MHACSLLGVSDAMAGGAHSHFSIRCISTIIHPRSCCFGLPACDVPELQISRQDVLLVDDTRLQDGMQQQWAAAAVAEHVAQAVQRFAPDKVSAFMLLQQMRKCRCSACCEQSAGPAT
jgi:hypothetical protein